MELIIKDKLIQIIENCSDMPDVGSYLQDYDDLIKLNMSSVQFIKMVIKIEEEFGFEFDDEKLIPSKFDSFNALITYVIESLEINNINYNPKVNDISCNELREELIQLIFDVVKNDELKKSGFNDLTTIAISTQNIEDIASNIMLNHDIVLNEDIIRRDELYMLDNLVLYINNMKAAANNRK